MPTAQELLNQGLPNVLANQPRVAVANNDFTGVSPSVRAQMAENAQLAVRGSYSPQVQADPYTQDFIQTGRLGAAGAAPAATRPYGTSEPIISGVTPGTSGVITNPTTGQVTTAPQASLPQSQQNDLASLYSSIRANNGATPVSGYADQLAQRKDLLRSNIDALNALYAGRQADARAQGAEQASRVSAVANAGGGLYGLNRFSQEGQVNDQTARQIAALDAQKNAEIAQLTLGLSGEASQAAMQNAQLAATERQNYVDNLMKTYGLSQNDAEQALKAQLAQADLTGQFGGQDTLSMKKYLADVQAQQAQIDLNNRELNFKIEDAQKKNYQMSQLDDGTVVAFDPTTGTFNKLGRYARPVSSGGDGSTYRPGSTPATTDIFGQRGADNYVNTAVYANKLAEAAAQGAGKDFRSRYPVEAYVNPYDPTAVPLFGGNPSYPSATDTNPFR